MIYIKIHLLSCFGFLANSFIIKVANKTGNPIEVRLRLKSSRFYENNMATFKTNLGKVFEELEKLFSKKFLERVSPASPTNQNLKYKRNGGAVPFVIFCYIKKVL